MPDTLLALSSAIVKAALRFWFKDDAAASIGDSVVDLLKGKISDELDQRKLQRLFEDLEIPVSDRLRTLRSTEFRAMQENEWKAAVLAAGASFKSADLSARELLARDLDPLSLQQLIHRNSAYVTRDLSADGTALYDRIVTEGASYIIEIADKLPQFRTGAVAELLHRDRQIVKMITEVLERIPKQISDDRDAAGFLTSYMRHVATRLDRLEVFGLDFQSSWYPLSIAYVSLHTDAPRLASVENIVAAYPRVMLQGRAGSGKTTVLQWLAVRAARMDLVGDLEALNDCIPFYIRLREYANRGLPPPEEFISSIAPMLANEVPRGWVRTQLRAGRSLVLVDGVDELPEQQRARVSKWIEELCQLFPNARYIVSARPAAVKPRWLAELKFNEVSLEAMSPALVQRFVHNWYEAARERATDTEETRLLTSYELSALRDLHNDKHLRDLADTPLLAGLLCALNRHLRSQLPRRRSDIYERAIVMFDQRDRVRQIGSSGTSMDLNAKVHLLSDLALWMIRNGNSEVDILTAREICGQSLRSLSMSDFRADSAIQFLLERSGLLREPTAARVDFVHRTFQEYLAAKAATDTNAIGELVRNAADVQWRDVVLFAAGQVNEPQANQLIHGLLGKPRHGTRRDQRILAISCLREVRRLSAGVRQSIQSIVPSLLPPQTMDQAEALAGAGTRLISPLSKFLTRNMDMAAECIRSASLVGGESALEVIQYIISEYPSHEAVKLVQEVARAWQYFDHDEYERRIVEPMRAMGVNIPDITRSLDDQI